MAAFLVTGTDTDAGKTLITSGLLALAHRQGLSTLGLKPVASGSDPTDAGLRNSDALALQAHSHPRVPYTTVNPHAFAPAIAPHLAAREAGITLTLDALSESLREGLALDRDLTLLEGAGGWRVPLNAREDLADLAAHLELSVILVVGLRLGCINHARLTAEAIRADGLRLAGWAGSLVDSSFGLDEALYRDNLATLERTLDAPCLGIVPHLPAGEMATAAADYLVLPES